MMLCVCVSSSSGTDAYHSPRPLIIMIPASFSNPVRSFVLFIHDVGSFNERQPQQQQQSLGRTAAAAAAPTTFTS